MAGTITVSLVSMVGDEGGKKRASERKNEEELRRGTAHSLFFFAHREPRTGYCPLREVSAALGG